MRHLIHRLRRRLLRTTLLSAPVSRRATEHLGRRIIHRLRRLIRNLPRLIHCLRRLIHRLRRLIHRLRRLIHRLRRLIRPRQPRPRSQHHILCLQRLHLLGLGFPVFTPTPRENLTFVERFQVLLLRRQHCHLRLHKSGHQCGQPLFCLRLCLCSCRYFILFILVLLLYSELLLFIGHAILL